MDDPWGLNEPGASDGLPLAPLPPRLAKLAALTEPMEVTDWADWDSPGREGLPEVAALLAEGWQLLGDDPRHVLLPAVFPRELRCWVPDRYPKTVQRFCVGGSSHILPAALAPRPQGNEADRGPSLEQEQAALAGLPDPPGGRIWLLRSPWPWLGLKVVLWLFSGRAGESGGYGDAHEVARAATEMLTWSDSELRQWWTGRDADAAAAWEQAGRCGEDVVELVCRQLGPDEVADLPGLTEQQVLAWCESVCMVGREAVERIQMWQSLGFSTDPPANAYRLNEWPEPDLRAWLEAGFGVADIVDLLGVALPTAVDWRAHGYDVEQVRALTDADPAIRADEVDAFVRAGFSDAALMPWIEYGFSAADAEAYRAVAVQANEARVWRSRGLGPADVQPGQALPPGYTIGGWVAFAGMAVRDIEHSVDDPDRTRGRIAAARLEDKTRWMRRSKAVERPSEDG